MEMMHAKFFYVLWMVTGVLSRFSAVEKMDIMKINMENIRSNLGSLTKSLNNKNSKTCTHVADDDVSGLGVMNQARFQREAVQIHTTAQELGGAIRDIKNSFQNTYKRRNDGCRSQEFIEEFTKTTEPEFGITNDSSITEFEFGITNESITSMVPGSSPAPSVTMPLQGTGVCKEGDFRCGDGSCIPTYWVCDGDEDCDDCSDEKDCANVDGSQVSCPPHMWECGVRSGKCIATAWRCDGDIDCDDGSDEENCNPAIDNPAEIDTYGPDDIVCGNGSRVPVYYRCDGSTDCDDCLDEASCVECPPEYSAVGHTCLRIDVVKRTWEEASQNCQRLGGRLAEPRDMDALKCFMQDEGGMRARYWVGGSKDEYGRWVWSKGGAEVSRSLLPSTARGRGRRYYNHQSEEDRMSEQCLEIMPMRTSHPFNTSNCRTKYRSLCHIDHIH